MGVMLLKCAYKNKTRARKKRLRHFVSEFIALHRIPISGKQKDRSQADLMANLPYQSNRATAFFIGIANQHSRSGCTPALPYPAYW